jgi:HSP20 family protein
MSGITPFTELGSIPHSFTQDISPIINYISTLEREFRNKHPFRSTYLPRFDLEEDSCNYYLYGDIPGASVENITVEAHEGKTLEVYGTNGKTGVAAQGDGEALHHCQKHGLPESKFYDEMEGQHAAASPNTTQSPASKQPHHHRILFSERITGPFHRTFAFPSQIEEEGIKAYMDNGVLTLVVPKKSGPDGIKKGKKIPIMKGSWFSGRKNSTTGVEVKNGDVN